MFRIASLNFGTLTTTTTVAVTKTTTTTAPNCTSNNVTVIQQWYSKIDSIVRENERAKENGNFV